ncbi:Signal transduction histidine kinase [Chitinophaga sp. CF118]|uniref:PAS domain-containing hybrid sensor histidine kinase/response regulator n=1 Tax=Chitinophaga sp. CF118 TaxID=1884367 RepID=UPI0008EE20B1|nr:PAS domain-containing hybrid sensor histidine kinase/response regulator [Chitinophaga sp. CF118]SFE85525.1 Signal transduction histidine kinase [Chitinophaga sp. CF118]
MAKSQIKSTQKHLLANHSTVGGHAIFSLPISTFLQNSNAGILLTDSLHRFIWCNQVFLRDAGIDASAIIGKPFTEVMIHMGQLMRHPEEFVAKMEDIRRKKKPFQGLELTLTDNRIYEISYIPLLEKRRFNGSIWQIVDISRQKMMKSYLEKARHQAEEARWAQKEFLASMSHEIRTPLNVIIGMTHLLGETDLRGEQQDYINILKHSSGILLGLISDILDISRIEAGELQVNQREFNLAELVQLLRHTFELKMGQRPVEISAEIDDELQSLLVGDDMLLNQILMNLLSNAEKFTREGEITIKVTVESWQEDKLWIQFRVCDTGIGIRKDRLELIFRNYKQAEQEIREKYGGTGLGLAISKQLVELQGGTIQVIDVPGFSTCFSFNLPFIKTRKSASTMVGAGSQSKRANFSGARVLVIEDNPMNLRYIISLLEKYNVNHQLATNGPDALYFLDSRQYDLVLLDIRIPGLNGLELAVKIREDEDKPNVATPLVATTALAMESTFTQARQAGITDILTKPYTPDQLLQVLNKYLNDDETEIIMEETTNTFGFEFHEELDVKYLNTLYENNISYAADLFEIFLKTVNEEMVKIQKLVVDRDWEQLKFQVHKLKPNFAMVGLTWISNNMQQLENTLNANTIPAPEGVDALFSGISRDLEKFYPIIAKEYERMKELETRNLN